MATTFNGSTVVLVPGTGGSLNGVDTIAIGSSITLQTAQGYVNQALSHGVPLSFITSFIASNPTDFNRIETAYGSGTTGSGPDQQITPAPPPAPQYVPPPPAPVAQSTIHAAATVGPAGFALAPTIAPPSAPRPAVLPATTTSAGMFPQGIDFVTLVAIAALMGGAVYLFTHGKL